MVIINCAIFVLEFLSNGILQISSIIYTKYNYNIAGNIIRKGVYIENEEYTTGKTIEETIYDDKGNVVKSFTYTVLTVRPSSILRARLQRTVRIFAVNR